MSTEKIWQAVLAGALAVFQFLLGGADTLLIVLLALMIMDYITGVVGACVSGTLSSAVGARGIAKKVLLLVVVALAVQLDRIVNGGSFMFRNFICYFYIANEGISILENAVKLGIPVPAKLKNALDQLKKK